MNQSALADALGVSQSLISKYETGLAPLPEDLAEKAARLFGVPPEVFRAGWRGREPFGASGPRSDAKRLRGADGSKLRLLRLHSKPPLKQADLARMLGVSQSLISKYEGGAFVPHGMVERLSRVPRAASAASTALLQDS